MAVSTAQAVCACSVCAGERVERRMRVAGDAGPDGLVPTTDRFGTALSDIVECEECGHMQLARFPSFEELDEAYADAESLDYVDEEAGQRATARAALESIERHVAPGTLLDVGCWVGFLLVEARERGWDATGVEPSTFASEFARERLGLDVQTSDLFTADLPTNAFDAVVLGDVIEHFPDPGAALARISELLAPGGVLWMALPDAGSRLARAMGKRWWSVIPTHVQYFTRDSIGMLLERRDYEVLGVDTAPKTFSVRYYLDRVSGYSPALGRGLVRAASAVRLANRLWTPDFRDRMAVIARPRA